MWPKFVNSGNLVIYTESFGFTRDPAILLIMGATASSIFWNTEFCQKLASAGYFVIRYDHRDTGKSGHINYHERPYFLKDLCNDAIAVLDAYELKNAHWVGASMGSFIAQLSAMEFPNRVLTLTCIMSSPKHNVFIDVFFGYDTRQHSLPASHPLLLRYYEEILSLEPKDIKEDKEMHSSIWKKISGNEHLMETRIFEGKVLKRLKSHKHIHNHSLALANTPSFYENLHNIKAPTLIIHGHDDYILPIEHGRRLAELITDAKFIEYKHMGHCLTNAIYHKLYLDVVDHFQKHS